uniref:Uncharacterized protein n=1 Tax=Kalanchoe fedtschenkoi TaxID=63787 RepID=A0A7N0TJ02_KALFE
MAVHKSPCFSCVSTSLPSPYSRRAASQLSLPRGLFENQRWNMRRFSAQVKSSQLVNHMLSSSGRVTRGQSALLAVSEERFAAEVEIVASEDSDQYSHMNDLPSVSVSSTHVEDSGGRPGLLSFYNRPYKKELKALAPISQGADTSISWFVGPAVLVASFILPSLYLRKVISIVFEDSLLTDFLILFFTEALFYGGVAVYLLLTDRLCRNREPSYTVNNKNILGPKWADRIASVAALALSLIVPMVTMGVVWPWTGPAASATLAPYLVGIVVQFAFEQYARYIKSPSWSIIPIVFQIYRLHQLNRAAQLVTALSFTVRGAEMTGDTLAIISSLGTLLNVLQFLGVICVWSLSSFIMRFFPLAAVVE